MTIVTVLLTAAVLSVPVIDPILFSALFMISLLAIFGEIRLQQKRWIVAVVIVACSLLLQQIVPATRILEKNNLFLRLSDGEPIQQALPKAVYEDMARSFEEQYPASGRCDKTTGGCWATSGVPSQGFAWSADQAFGEPTRVVSGIDFHDIASFRLGVINEVRYNWYGSPFSDIVRESAPFFVAYKFPPEVVGSTLCIRGASLWREGVAEWQKFASKESSCRQITNPATEVFAYSFDPATPLAMQLRKTPARMAWDLGLFVLRLLSAILIPLLLIRPLAASTFPVIIGAAGLLAIYWTYPTLLTELRVHTGGDDGLTHEGYGRMILQAAIAGKWRDVLMGAEPVFYYMPGLRYFRALEKLFFGDTNLGYVAAIAALPVAFYSVLKWLVPTRIAFVLAAGFVLTALFHRNSLGFFPYIEFAAGGYPDTLGYLLFLIGLSFGFGVDDDPQRYRAAIAAGFAFTLAVFVRPNLVMGAAVFLSLLGLLLIKRRQWRSLCFVALGVAPALLIPLHNYLFGGQLVLLTAAAFIKENLFLSPGQYVSAIAWKLFGSGQSADASLAAAHLQEWLIIMPTHQAIWFNATLLIASALVCIVPQQTWRVRALFATALSLHAGLWFWHAYGRYALLAWMLTMLTVVGGIASLARGARQVRLVSSAPPLKA